MNGLSEHQWLSIVSLVGFLILVLSGWRSHNVSARRAFYMAGAWAGIFAIVILFFSLMA